MGSIFFILSEKTLSEVWYFQRFVDILLFFLQIWQTLEGAALYAGLLLAPAEGFGQGVFLPFGQKKKLFTMAFTWKASHGHVATH